MAKTTARFSISIEVLLLWITLSFTALLISAVPGNAAYLTNVPQTLMQPDGSILECYASGDEYYNWLHDNRGYVIIQDHNTGFYVYAVKAGDCIAPSPYIAGRIDPERVGLEPNIRLSPAKTAERRLRFYGPGPSRFEIPGSAPTKGTINNLVVFIRFAGETEYTDALSVYDEMFNKTGQGANSMRNYFDEVSYKQLTISTTFYPIPSGTTVISYQDSHPRNYFEPYDPTTNPNGYKDDDEATEREHTLLKDAVTVVASQVPSDFVIDSDSDGNVDNVCFIVSGSPGAWADLLWPHRWMLSTQDARIAGKRVWDYNFQLRNSLMSAGVGVLCHEMFHSLGSPDLYHYSGDGLSPVWQWDIMEHDLDPPQHMGAYMKFRYGKWLSSVTEITTPGTYMLSPLTSATNNCYKIKSPNSTTEYFMVEYRKNIGTFEGSLPGSGLLVYRINSAQDGKGNRDGPPDEVYIYRPGGTTSVNGNPANAVFSSDVGRTSIDDTTNPSSFLSDGSPGGLQISNVTAAGDTISFTVGGVDGTKVATPIFTPDAGTFDSAIDVIVTCPTPGATIHYTTNGADPAQTDPVIASGGRINIPQTTMLQAKAWKDPLTPSDTKSANYVINATKVATPTFTPDGGTFTGPQNVVVTCATPGATIHYTTNGADPTEADLTVNSGGSVYVDRSLTLKAGAWMQGLNPSDIKSADYTINIPVLYVRPTGDDLNSGTTWALARRTITAALKSITTGSEIWVAAGIYKERITMKAGAGIYGGFLGNETTRDQRNWTVNESVLDGSGLAPVITVPAGASSVVDGFTITNGNGLLVGGNRLGGAIYCNSGSSAIVTNNNIINNGGSAIYAEYSAPVIANNVISENTADFGGAIYILSSSAMIANNTIVRNSATSSGGGIFCSFSSPTIANNVVTLNDAGIYNNGGTLELLSNCVYGNSEYDYSGVSAGTSDIRKNPLLADPWDGNYHLTNDSPCIDAGYDGIVGSNWLDMDCTSRIVGAHVDMGADEALFKPAVSLPAFNPDGGAFTSAQAVTVTCDTKGATIRYTTNGSDPTESSSSVASGGTVTVNRNLTLKARAYKSGMVPSDIKTAEYTVTGTVATPSFSPDGGSYASPQRVRISCSTAGATIHYTLNGNDPTESDPAIDSGSSIMVEKTLVLKAKAWKAGWDPSQIRTAFYTLPRIIRVKPTGSDGNDGGSWLQAKRTLQGALNVASESDEIWVAAGIYIETISLTPGVALYGGFAGNESSRDERNWSRNHTVLDGNGWDSVVTILPGADETTRIDGFIITNGCSDYGGGIYISNASPTIANNTITWNAAWMSGGGVFSDAASAPIIVSNVLSWNDAAESGGGICCLSNAVVVNNTIVDNTAEKLGGGVLSVDSSPTIANNIIAFNSSGITHTGVGGPVLTNNCVYENSDLDYQNITAGVGDISLDPVFIDRAGGDYHIFHTSPCMDAGDDGSASGVSVDIDGQTRVYGENVDIGADERMPTGPENISLSPNSGVILSEAKLKLTARYHDVNGDEDIAGCYLLLNEVFSGAGAAYLYYDAAADKLYLRNDDNTAWTGGFTPKSGNVIENSQCTVYCAETSVQKSNGTVTVAWNVRLKDSVSRQTCYAWMLCIDDSNLRDDWDRMGTYSVSQSPTNTSLSPASAVVSPQVKQTLVAKYSDGDGCADISRCYTLINTTLTGARACYLYYDAAANKLYVRNDDNTAWVGGYAPGSAYVVENSYFKLYCAETAVSRSGTYITISYRIEFKSAFSGRSCSSWMMVQDRSGLRDDWERFGSLRISTAPSVLGFAPASATLSTGAQCSWTSRFSDADGYTSITDCYTLINSGFSGANAAYLRYDSKNNRLYVRNDANTGWLGGYAPGSANVIENSSCRLFCASTTKSGTGTGLVVNWKVMIKSNMSGKSLGVWQKLYDDAGLYDGWDRNATLIVQ